MKMNETKFPVTLYYRVDDFFSVFSELGKLDRTEEELFTIKQELDNANKKFIYVSKKKSVLCTAPKKFNKRCINALFSPASSFAPKNDAEFDELAYYKLTTQKGGSFIDSTTYLLLKDAVIPMEQNGLTFYFIRHNIYKFTYNSGNYIIVESFLYGEDGKTLIAKSVNVAVGFESEYGFVNFKPFPWMKERIEPRFNYVTDVLFLKSIVGYTASETKNYYILDEDGNRVEEDSKTPDDGVGEENPPIEEDPNQTPDSGITPDDGTTETPDVTDETPAEEPKEDGGEQETPPEENEEEVPPVNDETETPDVTDETPAEEPKEDTPIDSETSDETVTE